MEFGCHIPHGLPFPRRRQIVPDDLACQRMQSLWLAFRRGLGNDESAQKFADAQRIKHDFLNPHSGLPGNITPAEVAGIDLNLGDDKIRDLISQGSQKKNFVTHLGKRVDKVTIVNETDSIKVAPKTWIDKRIWREINDIPRLSGFSWLSNGKHSCWIKPARE